MKQLVYQVCYTKYHVSFYLWLIGFVLKHCKVPKYYEQYCRMKTNIVFDISPPIPVWQNSGSGVIGKKAVGQSNCAGFLKM